MFVNMVASQEFMVARVHKNDTGARYDGIFGMALSASSSWLQDGPEAPMSNAVLQPRNAFSFYVYMDKERKSGYGGEVSRKYGSGDAKKYSTLYFSFCLAGRTITTTTDHSYTFPWSTTANGT